MLLWEELMHPGVAIGALVGVILIAPAVGDAKPMASGAMGGMVRLPGGTYTMGETKMVVTVEPFQLDLTPVTVLAYKECVEEGKCSSAKLNHSDGGSDSYCNWGRSDRANDPINCVDWNQATAYCAAVGKRLPTEQEREWAARGGGAGTRYPWGNGAPSVQLCWDSGNVQRAFQKLGTCPVGSFPSGDSPQGLRDLAGNVSEWTSSADGLWRIVRGGAWDDDDPRGVAAANRNKHALTARFAQVGFRCARAP